MAAITGNRRKSRAPARKLRRIKSGEASREAQMIAVAGHSALRRSTNFSAASERASGKVMIAAFGRRRTISGSNCSASSPPTSRRVRS